VSSVFSLGQMAWVNSSEMNFELKESVKMEKNTVAIILSATMIFSATVAFANGYETNLINEIGFEEARFISPKEYMATYGKDAIIQGFSDSIYLSLVKAHKAHATDMNSDMLDERSIDKLLLVASDEAILLFDSIRVGFWADMKILGVSDLPPSDPMFELKLEPPPYFENRQLSFQSDDVKLESNNTRSYTTINGTSGGIPYRVHHNGSFDLKIEPPHGAFFYKYSWWNSGDSAAEVDVVFNNTTIKFSNQYSHNAYIYVAAQNNNATIDFGVMSAKDVPHLRPFYNVNNPKAFHAWPNQILGVAAPDASGNRRFTNGTLQIHLHVTSTSSGSGAQRLRIGTGGGVWNLFTFNSAFSTLKFDHRPGVNNGALSFIQAMSFVRAGGNTTTTSGAHLGQVTFRNQRLLRKTANVPGGGGAAYVYTVNRTTPFSTNSTGMRYVFIQRPNNCAYTISGQEERVTITY